MESLSILIPARNEEKFLPRCLACIKASENLLRERVGNVPIEKICIINRCTDATETIASADGCRIVYNESKNLAAIRNAGAKAATGDIIITIDADSYMAPTMLPEIYRVLTTRKVIGGGVLTFPERWSLGIFLTGVALLPVLLWHRVSAGLFFCYRKDFEAIGGFNEDLVSVEDIDFGVRLKMHGRAQGKRYAHLVTSSMVTSCRKFDRLGDWYFLRNFHKFIALLGGRNRKVADEIWYDFKR